MPKGHYERKPRDAAPPPPLVVYLPDAVPYPSWEKCIESGPRPPFNKAAIDAVCERIENRIPVKLAVASLGLSWSHFSMWLESGEADNAIGKPSAAGYLQFRIANAKLRCVSNALANLGDPHAKQDAWRKHAWFLERTYGEYFDASKGQLSVETRNALEELASSFAKANPVMNELYHGKGKPLELPKVKG